MSLTFKKSNGLSVPVQDSEINRIYSTSLLGRDVEDYGSSVAQSLFQLSENYASDLPPESNPFVNFNNNDDTSPAPVTPVTGQLWFDTSVERLKVYNSEVSSPTYGWTLVAQESTTQSLVPARDSEQNIGTDSLYWHEAFVTHLTLNTNRYAGQVGVSDPDGIPALSIDGNTVLSNSKSSTGNVSKITAESGSFIDLGEYDNPIKSVFAEELRFGEGRNVILKEIVENNVSSIVPISESGNQVNLGNAATPFNAITVETANVSNLGGDGNNDINLIGGTYIVPESDSGTGIGSTTKRLASVHVNQLYVTSLNESPNQTFTVSDTIGTTVFESGVDNLPNGSLTPATDKVVIVKDDGAIEKASYMDFFPVGMTMMWNGNIVTIPSGWKLCNGDTYTNGILVANGTGDIKTPNLVNRFIKGVDDDGDVGANGSPSITLSSTDTMTSTSAGNHSHGGDTAGHVLSISEMPAHTHAVGAYSGVGGGTISEPYEGQTGASSTSGSTGSGSSHDHGISSDGTHTHNVTHTHSHTIGIDDLNNYAMVFITKVI